MLKPNHDVKALRRGAAVEGDREWVERDEWAYERQEAPELVPAPPRGTHGKKAASGTRRPPRCWSLSMSYLDDILLQHPEWTKTLFSNLYCSFCLFPRVKQTLGKEMKAGH